MRYFTHGLGLIVLLFAVYLVGVQFPAFGESVLGMVGLGGE